MNTGENPEGKAGKTKRTREETWTQNPTCVPSARSQKVQKVRQNERRIGHFICTSFSNLLEDRFHFIQALFDEDLSIGVSHCFSLQHLMQVLQFSAVIEMASDPLLDPFAGFRP